MPLTQPATIGEVGNERSPYGMRLGITYPKADLDRLLAAVEAAQATWRKAGPEAWVGVCLEILSRINQASFELAHAIMHTTGQAFVMAFQAGGPARPGPRARGRRLCVGPDAQDSRSARRGRSRRARTSRLRMEKHFRIVPRGVALVIGCCTFPTWNGYPGLFASLATGNAVVVKPHPAAILPLAITVRIAREVLAEAGFDPNVVTLVAHDAGDATAQTLALRPEIKIVDFTGSTANGRWLEEHARQAQVYTEKAGVNQVIVDSTADFKGMVRNLAFSLALYTGQMCTAPQNIYVPKDGIDTAEGHLGFDDVAKGLAEACQTACSTIRRAPSRCWAPCRTTACCAGSRQPARWARSRSTRRRSCIRSSPRRTVRTPLIVKLVRRPIARPTSTSGSARSPSSSPPTAPTRASRSPATPCVGHGALTMSVYSTRDDVIERAIEVAEDVGVALSINLTGGVFVNQSAAFSDFHGTGANPAANAALTDAAFVANRFRVVQHRAHA